MFLDAGLTCIHTWTSTCFINLPARTGRDAISSGPPTLPSETSSNDSRVLALVRDAPVSLSIRTHVAFVDVELKLACPPPQKRSPTIGGNRQLGSASITVRLRSPIPASEVPSSSATAVESASSSLHEDDTLSDAVLSDAFRKHIHQL